MKKLTPEEKLRKHCRELLESVRHWKDIRDNGCNDPGWTDGVNMNLVRNHIICHKRVILDLCSENGFTLPEEYYVPTPPEVSMGYMASLRQKERVRRLIQMGRGIDTKRPVYDDTQMSFL